jgi:hypothetical protein
MKARTIRIVTQLLGAAALAVALAACAPEEDQCLEFALCQLRVLRSCEDVEAGTSETCFTNSVPAACGQLDSECEHSTE